MTMDFRILKKIIYSEEYVGLGLNQFYNLKENIEKLKLPLLSRLTDYYANDITFGVLEIDQLSDEIDKLMAELKDSDNANTLNDLKSLVEQAKKEKKPMQVLTD